MDELLDLRQAAEFLNISLNTMRCYVAWGVIPAVKLGRGMMRFRPEDLQAYLNQPSVQAYRRGRITGNESR